jgi:hypothetical protein
LAAEIDAATQSTWFLQQSLRHSCSAKLRRRETSRAQIGDDIIVNYVKIQTIYNQHLRYRLSKSAGVAQVISTMIDQKKLAQLRSK